MNVSTRLARAALWAVPCIAAALLAAGTPARAQDAKAAREQKLADLSRAMASPPERITRSPGGFLRNIAAKPGASLPVKAAASATAPVSGGPAGTAPGSAPAAPATPEGTARQFLKDWSDLFHTASPSIAWTTLKFKTSGTRNYVRLRQTYSGLTVYGAEAILQVNPEGIVSVSSNILHDLSSFESGATPTAPGITSGQARQAAVASMGGTDDTFAVTTPSLMVYDPPVLGHSGGPELVWQTVVQSVSGAPVKEFILVNAQTGKVSLHYSLIQTLKQRQIFDSNNTSADPGAHARFEGEAPSANAEVNLAYTYFGDTYDFYLTHHGRDGIDNAGTIMSATTRFCPPGRPCPYPQAEWISESQRMYFGDGYAAADDVVGHELTHGVTQHESALIYQGESGAINESFSDIWGEFIDLSNTGGEDDITFRWLIGEDLPGLGVIRDMRDPTHPLPSMEGSPPHPDRYYSPLFRTGPDDNGGVHSNSGVGNKLAYLLTDGDTFNGHTVTGMGLQKTVDLYYEVQINLLAASANYFDLRGALAQAAINLGFTEAERLNLDEACLAVEICLCPLGQTVDDPPPGPSGNEKQFGESVAVSGDVVVVGAPYDEIGGAVTGGRAYLIDAATGAITMTLNNPDPAAGPGSYPDDQFGKSVAVSGNTVLVAANTADMGDAIDAGVVYVFNATTGALVERLDNPEAPVVDPPEASPDFFGTSVALSASVAVVGSPYDTSGGAGARGTAFLFNAETGALVAVLGNPVTTTNDYFGQSVAVSGNVGVVGAYGADPDGVRDAGAAYLFNATTGAFIMALDNPEPVIAASFGISVGIFRDLAVVGAYGGAGKAYIFNVTDGSLVATLLNPGTSAFASFGYSVAITEGAVVVGALDDDPGGVNEGGTAYVFHSATGGLAATLNDPSPAARDSFGNAVAISSNVVVVGAANNNNTGGFSIGPGSAFIFNCGRARAAAPGRELGDFDSSGCTNLLDFLFLLDNWQTLTPIGGAIIGVADFLAMLDNWNTGPNC